MSVPHTAWVQIQGKKPRSIRNTVLLFIIVDSKNPMSLDDKRTAQQRL